MIPVHPSSLCLLELEQLLCFLRPVYLTICLPLFLPPLSTAFLDLAWCVSLTCLLLLDSSWFAILLLVFFLLFFVLLLSLQNLAEKSICHNLSQLFLKVEYVPWGHDSSKSSISGCCFDNQAEFLLRIFALCLSILLSLFLLGFFVLVTFSEVTLGGKSDCTPLTVVAIELAQLLQEFVIVIVLATVVLGTSHLLFRSFVLLFFLLTHFYMSKLI